MALLTFFAVLLTRLAPAAALPTHQPRDAFTASNTSLTCIFLTNEPNWSGEMQNLCEVAGVCASQLPTGLTANVSSAGPTDGQTCFLYTGPSCSGTRSNPIVYPGYADLSVIDFDKQAVSWMCWKMCGYIVESSSSASVSTVQPTIPTAGGPTSTVADTSTLANSSIPTVRELARDITTNALAITTTLSPIPPAPPPSTTPDFIPSITKTLTASIPPVKPSSSTQSSTSADTPQTTTPPPATSTPTPTQTMPSTISAKLTTFSLVSIPPTTTSITINTNTPGFSMSPSPVTLTHTFADGSTQVVTETVIQPVPTVPTPSSIV